MRSPRLVALLAATTLAGAGGGTVWAVQQLGGSEQRDRADAAAAATAWLAAWQDRAYDRVDQLTAGQDAPGDALRRTDARLQTRSQRLVPGPLSPDGATVPYSGSAQLAGLGEFTWSSRVQVVRSGGGWRVRFDAQTLHPQLRYGQRLDRGAVPGPRAPIADRRGRPVRAASPDLAANVLGRAGSPASGLERVLTGRLTSRTDAAVVITERKAQVSVLRVYAGRSAAPLRTTLDLDVQRAAEQALAGVGAPATAVVLDTATAQVRAVASSPVQGRSAAFTRWAPGSVFKTVTAAALLDAGLTGDTPVACPATWRGTGNASSVRPGPMTLRQALAVSCNTAFLSAAERLPEGALARAAEQFGVGLEPLLPIATQTSTFPTGGGPADATAAIGQGRVQASPLLVASWMSAAATGTWRQPSLLPDTPGLVSRPLPPRVAAGLPGLLRAAVRDGSAQGVDLPGEPVHGKTGSAEVGSRGQVHAWFAGYRGPYAVCVFVESGESGAATAVPVARRLLTALG